MGFAEYVVVVEAVEEEGAEPDVTFAVGAGDVAGTVAAIEVGVVVVYRLSSVVVDVPTDQLCSKFVAAALEHVVAFDALVAAYVVLAVVALETFDM